MNAMNQLKRRQRGIGSLFVSIVMLILGTLLVVTVSRMSLTEQRTAGNEYRRKQAFEAAEAGLNQALTQLSAGIRTDQTAPVILEGNAKFTYALCSHGSNTACPDVPGAIACTPPDSSVEPRIVSCGWSDDNLGRVRITQLISTVPGLSAAPTNPLTSKGAVNVQGSATITNYFNNLTIWTGNALTSVGNSGKTFIRNPLNPVPAPGTSPPAPPNSCQASATYVCLTDKNTIGPDVIEQDPTLFNQSNLFQNYTGVNSVADYIATRSPIQVSSAESGTIPSLLTNTSPRRRVVVINENLTNNLNVTIGALDDPVLLIVNGNWTGGGNTTVYGMVYVTGNVDLSGNKTIYGSMVVEGTVAGTGSLDVIFTPFGGNTIIENTARPGLMAGTWRDWN